MSANTVNDKILWEKTFMVFADFQYTVKAFPTNFNMQKFVILFSKTVKVFLTHYEPIKSQKYSPSKVYRLRYTYTYHIHLEPTSIQSTIPQAWWHDGIRVRRKSDYSSCVV